MMKNRLKNIYQKGKGYLLLILAILGFSTLLLLFSSDNVSPVLYIVVLAALLIWFIIRHKNKRIADMEALQNQVESNLSAEAIDPSESILYLRPFKADLNNIVKIKSQNGTIIKKSPIKYWSNTINQVTFKGKKYIGVEALICGMLRDYGMPIAIGDPGERERNDTVVDGASRIYTDDASWKDIATKYFESSRLVILYVDFTEGVKWEISQAVTKYRDKVIFVPKVFNAKTRVLETLMSYEFGIFLLYPIYFLFVKHLYFSHIHRGWTFYRKWKKTFGFAINDTVSAVRFINGKLVFYRITNGTIEAQMEAVLSSITSK